MTLLMGAKIALLIIGMIGILVALFGLRHKKDIIRQVELRNRYLQVKRSIKK